jgi:hypothetical protein
MDSMALRFLERRLGRALAQRCREDLVDAAVGSVGLTDDGGTIYVHLTPREGWPHRAQGRAFVLAWEDYEPDSGRRLECYRHLVREAKLSLRDNMDRIVRWLEGR